MLCSPQLWLAIILNFAGFATIVVLISSIGIKRLLSGAIKTVKRKRRAKILRQMELDKIEEKDAKEMTKGEFVELAHVVKVNLARRFPSVPAFKEVVTKLKDGRRKFLGNEDFRKAVKEWIAAPLIALDTYADISFWDTSNITDMQYLFAEAEYFNDDISSWNVSAVTTFKGCFR